MSSEVPQASTLAGNGRVTITDVARAARVSVATVSKVTNGRGGVAPETAERVLEVVQELGYETSIVAAAMRRSSTNVIGILVADFDPFAAELLKGIARQAAGKGYELLAYTGTLATENPVGWERRSLSRLGGTLIDAAIVVTPTVELPSASVPVVVIDPQKDSTGVPAILSDNYAGAKAITEHLISLGHHRIAHISGRDDLHSALLREQGYRDALTAAGIECDPDLIRRGSYRTAWTVEPARELLSSPERPTAIFAANDLSAFGVLQAAAQLGLRVPEDLSVVGFDDIPESAYSTPKLTTVAQPLKNMGAAAVDLLLARLAAGATGDASDSKASGASRPAPRQADDVEHILLPSRLVIRDSAGPAPSRTHTR